jgi:glycosyltransferase involved in cell wall biosynthesis
VGRITGSKGLSYLIKAFGQVVDRGKNIRLSIVGEGEERAALEQLVEEKDLGDLVVFVGFVNHDGIPQLLLRYDAFILPSLVEGFCLSVVEAMAAGLPVIVTQCGGPEDYVDESTGIICPSGDVDSLRDAIETFVNMEPEKLTKMGMEGRRQVENFFNVRHIAQDNIELFEECIQAY